jgi:hypothetical protein
MKIRATIDIDECEESMNELTSLERGAFGCDKDGAYSMWYGSRTDLVPFHDVEILEKDKQKVEGYTVDKNDTCFLCDWET